MYIKLNYSFQDRNKYLLNVSRAMANPGAKEQFLKQFENIVEGIKQNKAKVGNSLFL